MHTQELLLANHKNMIEKMWSLKDKHREQKEVEQKTHKKKDKKEGKKKRAKRVKEGRKIINNKRK